jgi:hypothetical protein
MNQKNVIHMVHNEKIMKQKNSLSSGIIISFGSVLAVVGVVAGLIFGFGGTFSTVAEIYLGYKLLKLILRVMGLFVALLLTLVSAVFLGLIILFIIF